MYFPQITIHPVILKYLINKDQPHIQYCQYCQSTYHPHRTHCVHSVSYTHLKPFATSHAKQIGFVTDLTWLDFQKLNGIENDCKKILSSSKYIDETRCENICYSISKRIDMLKDLL